MRTQHVVSDVIYSGDFVQHNYRNGLAAQASLSQILLGIMIDSRTATF